MSTAPGFVKHDSKKPRFGLLPPRALASVANVLTFGAEKYAAWNWIKCPSRMRYYDAIHRHLNAWVCGEDDDAESGISHLAHAACCLLFLMELHLLGLGEDDRPTDNRLRDEHLGPSGS